jgi:hypothetical protein
MSGSDLEQMLTPRGVVQSPEVTSGRTTGKSQGFGFVEMGSDQEA